MACNKSHCWLRYQPPLSQPSHTENLWNTSRKTLKFFNTGSTATAKPVALPCHSSWSSPWSVGGKLLQGKQSGKMDLCRRLIKKLQCSGWSYLTHLCFLLTLSGPKKPSQGCKEKERQQRGWSPGQSVGRHKNNCQKRRKELLTYKSYFPFYLEVSVALQRNF